jgi:hypothetical protein
MQYTGLKPIPAGKTADFQVGKTVWGTWYYFLNKITVVK